MGEMIPLYGFKGRNGATLTVTAPAGTTVTVSKDGKSKLPKFSDGAVVFKGLSTGTWTITITNGTDTASKNVEIKADYEADITFFTATLHISYPAGAVCKATNGSTTLTAPDTSGTWACTVDKAGTWTVTAGDLTETVTLNATGETKTVIVGRWIVKNGVLTDIGLTNPLISGRKVTQTQETGYVAIKNAQSLVAGIATGKTLDLTAARKIVADIDVTTVGASKDYTQYDGINLVTSKAISAADVTKSIANMTAYLDDDHIANTTGRKTLELDVSSLTGSHYVGFAIGTKGAFSVYSLYVL
jgi:hypothetical protein